MSDRTYGYGPRFHHSTGDKGSQAVARIKASVMNDDTILLNPTEKNYEKFIKRTYFEHLSKRLEIAKVIDNSIGTADNSANRDRLWKAFFRFYDLVVLTKFTEDKKIDTPVDLSLNVKRAYEVYVQSAKVLFPTVNVENLETILTGRPTMNRDEVLAAENKLLRASVLSLQARLEELDGQKAETERQIVTMTAEKTQNDLEVKGTIEQLQRMLSAHDEKSKEHKTEIDGYTAKIGDMEKQIKSLLQTKSSLQESVAACEQNVSDISTKMETINSQIDSNKKEIQRLEEVRNQKENEIGRQAERIQSIQRERDDVTQKLSDTEKSMSELTNAITTLTKGTGSTAAATNWKDAFEEHQAEFRNRQVDMKAAQQRLTELETKRESLQVSLDKCESSVQSLTSEKNSISERLGERETAISRLNGELESLKSKARDLESDLSSQNSKSETLQQTFSEKVAEISKIGDKLSECESLKAGSDEALRSSQEKLQLLTEEMEKSAAAFEKIIEGLREKHALCENSTSDLQTRLSDVTSKLESSNVENSRLLGEEIRIKAENENLLAEEIRVKAENEALTREEIRVKAENERLLQEETRIKTENEALTREKERMGPVIQGLETEMVNIKKALEESIKDGKTKKEVIELYTYSLNNVTKLYKECTDRVTFTKKQKQL
jgi:chromosome segregation ATPase